MRKPSILVASVGVAMGLAACATSAPTDPKPVSNAKMLVYPFVAGSSSAPVLTVEETTPELTVEETTGPVEPTPTLEQSAPTVTVTPTTEAPTEEPTVSDTPTSIEPPKEIGWEQIVNRFGAYEWRCLGTEDCSNAPITNICLFVDGYWRMCNTGASLTPYPLYNEDGSVTTLVGQEFPIIGGSWTPSGTDEQGNQITTWHLGA